MSDVTGALLWECLLDPKKMADIPGRRLSDLLNLAWQQGVIFRLASAAVQEGVAATMPPQIAGALEDIALQANHNARRLAWEINRVAAALQDVSFPVLLLKGGAYQGAGFEFAGGRLASDVDVLVPRAHLSDCEAAFQAAGWAFENKTEYDDRYYRNWMHELPPMRHEKRNTIMDLHHTVLPPVARITPDVGAIIDAAVEVDDIPLKRPSLPDLVVHSALHCFYDGDFSNNLRSLLDLHDLIALGIEADADFMETLCARATRHEAGRPVADALRTLSRMGALQLNDTAKAFVNGHARLAPLQGVFDWAVARRTLGVGPFWSGESWLACKLLYIRSHWITMPPGMLAKHLSTKALMRMKGQA